MVAAECKLQHRRALAHAANAVATVRRIACLFDRWKELIFSTSDVCSMLSETVNVIDFQHSWLQTETNPSLNFNTWFDAYLKSMSLGRYRETRNMLTSGTGRIGTSAS